MIIIMTLEQDSCTMRIAELIEKSPRNNSAKAKRAI